MAATVATNERAEQLKQKGNQCFQKGKFNAAIDMYTEAIVLHPGQSTFYSNRALCHSKLEHWASCRDDCVLALKYDPLNAKAGYLLGTSHVHLLAFEDSFAAFQSALQSAEKTSKSKAFRQEITVELRRARKKHWHHQQKQHIQKHETMKKDLALIFQSMADLPFTDAGVDGLMQYTEHMANTHENAFYTGEIPDYYMCPVSMEIMLDPVTTPNGVSYERRCIEEHLRTNGAVDPLTRKTLTLDMLRPNTNLRAAIQDYLDKHPWAFEH